MLYFSFAVFVHSMSECVVLFQIDFTSTNRGKGEIHGFLFQIVQISSLMSEFLSFSIATFGNVIY